MQLILRKDVEGLGELNEVVEVKDGYARNFLIPQNLAQPATKGALKHLEHEKNMALAKEKKEKVRAEQLQAVLNKISCTAPVKVGQDDKVFGSVTREDVARMLQDEGIQLDKKKILLPEPLNTLGVHMLKVRLHPDVFAEVKVWLVKR